jgi:large subunit ribosomal protein L22
MTKNKPKSIPPVTTPPAVVSSAPQTVSFSVFQKMVHMSPQKLRLVAKQLKGLKPSEALTRLKLTNTKRTRIFADLIKQLISDAQNNFALDPSSLSIKKILVDEGQKFKRTDKSHSARFQSGIRITRKSKIKIIAEGQKHGTQS